MKKSFKYRLYPNKTEIKNIDNQLFHACILYNCALQERKEIYRISGKNINYYYQANQLKELRKENLTSLANFSCCQDILRRVDKTYKAFFARIKRGDKAGFPRFKSPKRFDTIIFPAYGDGCKLKGKKVYLQGIGDVNIRLHRPVDGEIKTMSITRSCGKYYIVFSCEVENIISPETNKAIGIDMGLENFMTTSDGAFIDNPRYFKEAQNNLRVRQKSVSRKKKGSARRRKEVRLLAKQHQKVANQRKDFLHKQSNDIVKQNDIICIEDLNIKGLTKGMLAKSVNDVAWGMFFNFLIYKAEYAGKKVIKVNPNGTSQRCNKCGTVVKKDLSVRWHDCPVCFESCHRDINSALEILRLGTNPDALTWNISSCVASEVV